MQMEDYSGYPYVGGDGSAAWSASGRTGYYLVGGQNCPGSGVLAPSNPDHGDWRDPGNGRSSEVGFPPGWTNDPGFLDPESEHAQDLTNYPQNDMRQLAVPPSVSRRNGSGNSYRGSESSRKRKRRRIISTDQRRAANIRERKRMFQLNEAFAILRKCVPTFAYEKKLSRIETLRLAVIYIEFMADLLKSENGEEGATAIDPGSFKMAGNDDDLQSIVSALSDSSVDAMKDDEL